MGRDTITLERQRLTSSLRRRDFLPLLSAHRHPGGQISKPHLFPGFPCSIQSRSDLLVGFDPSCCYPIRQPTCATRVCSWECSWMCFLAILVPWLASRGRSDLPSSPSQALPQAGQGSSGIIASSEKIVGHPSMVLGKVHPVSFLYMFLLLPFLLSSPACFSNSFRSTFLLLNFSFTHSLEVPPSC